MLRKIALAAVAVSVLAACEEADGVLQSLAPHVFYGFPSRATGNVLCVYDAREENPTDDRCFEFTPDLVAELAGRLERDDVLRIRYEPAEEPGEPARALSIEEVNPRH